MRDIERMEVNSFSTKQDLANFLYSLIDKCNSICEFNVLGHQISDMRDYFSFGGGDLVGTRLIEILSHGLNVSNYGTIYSTTNLLSNSNNIDINNVVDYAYYKMNKRVVCICLLPKYVPVNGELVEFSSYHGKGLRMGDERLMDNYKKANVYPYSDHIKCCMLDAIKFYDELMPNVILGCYYIDEEKNEFKFYNTKKNFVYNAIDMNKYFKEQKQKILQAYKEFNTTDLDTILIEAYKQEESRWDDAWAMDI